MQDRDPAPIVLFAYKRRDHLKATIESLARNPQACKSNLFIFSDGPRTSRDALAVAEVRDYIAGITGFLQVQTVERRGNLGLATSIIGGVTQILDAHDRIIVLEDDMVVSPHFLAYMNDGLACYEGDEAVASIHGYMYPTSQSLPETFFLRGADCWGWATWRRAWRHFKSDGKELLAQLQARNAIRNFDYDGVAPFSNMLKQQIAGVNDSWAIRWHAACYLDGMFTLYPGRTLVHNIGNDGTGTHGAAGASGRQFDNDVADAPVDVRRLPVLESEQGKTVVRAFFQRTQRSGFRGKMAQAAGRVFRAIRSG